MKKEKSPNREIEKLSQNLQIKNVSQESLKSPPDYSKENQT